MTIKQNHVKNALLKILYNSMEYAHLVLQDLFIIHKIMSVFIVDQEALLIIKQIIVTQYQHLYAQMDQFLLLWIKNAHAQLRNHSIMVHIA